MNKVLQFFEDHFVPIAARLGSQKHLVAIRDGFIAVMPITMAGSISILLNVFFRDMPQSFGLTGFVEAMGPLVAINSIVSFATISILAFVFVFALGYNLSLVQGANPLPGGIISFACLLATIPSVEGSIHIDSYASAKGIFTAMFVGIISAQIYVFFVKKKLIISLPDSVPPAVNKAFAAMIPGIVAIYVVSIVSYLTNEYGGLAINDIVLKYIQMPLLGLSQGLGSVIIVLALMQIFWFFGLHGPNVLAPITQGVYGTALNENILIYQQTNDISQPPYFWTSGSFEAYTHLGGSGMTIALIIAIFIASKRKEYKAIAKIATPMGFFNINEPITFGIPIVLNPIYLIPWVLVPVIGGTIAYLFTSFGIIPPIFVSVPWITPPILNAFLATGGNFLAAGVALLNLVIGFFIYLPFVKIANKN